uniref:Uncharacterized protein n=1 Tax=viral metagenome TaxID=1070528 RepID=A0A6M3LFC9_9ZZZZ
MNQINFKESGIFLKNIIADKLFTQGKLEKEDGHIFIEKAFHMADGRIKVVGYQYSKEFPFKYKIDWENKEEA